MVTNEAWTQPTPKKSPAKPIIFVLIGAAVFVMMCLGGVVLLGGNRPLAKDPVIPPYETAPSGQSRVGSQTPPVPPMTFMQGKGNTVAPIGSTLTGTFTVEYSFGSWCGIVHFLKADGSDGAEFFEMVNECAGDINAKAKGSTIVHLTSVTMVKVENTSGNWSLKFISIG